MPLMPPNFRASGRPTLSEQRRDTDRRRGSARERGYDSKWDKAAKGHLDHDPLCRYCALADETTAATLVDHLYPHKGDRKLFWTKVFWVSSCKDCHDSFKQRVERKGVLALDDLARRLDLPTLDEFRRSHP